MLIRSGRTTLTITTTTTTYGELPTLTRGTARGAVAFLVAAAAVAMVNLGRDPADVGYRVVGWAVLLAAVVLGLVSFLDRHALADGRSRAPGR